MKTPAWVYYGIAIALMFGPAIFIVNMINSDNNKAESEPSHFGNFIFLGVLAVLAVLYFTYDGKKSKKKWKTGVFDGKQRFSEDTLLQAYVRLGGLMLRKDTEDIKGKMVYLHRYFERHFENAYARDLTTALNTSFHHPVELNSITPWLKRNLRSKSQRLQLIYFLAGLGAVDGSINPREKQYLWQLSDQLDVSRKDFESIMAMYMRYEDNYNRQRSQQRTSSKSRSQYQREQAAKVLGISVNASIDEIKKAYRGLAKVHHPDKFAGESESQQKIAEERFIQIQQAYELMLEFKN